MERGLSMSGRFFEIGSSSSRLTPQPIFPIENLSKTLALLQGSDYPIGSSLLGLPPDLLSLPYLIEDPAPPPLQLIRPEQDPTPIRFESDKLKSPKLELGEEHNYIPTVHPDQSLLLLPSLEYPPLVSYPIDGLDLSTVGSVQKRLRTLPYADLEHPPLDQSSSHSGSVLPLVEAVANAAPAAHAYPRCTLARRRRKRLSDRTRSLEGLMPWERKMDTATLLEEAHKYVRFLEAQVSALQGMPGLSGLPPTGPNPVRAGGFGGLERLNRQQMLQVLVNSARVQEKLYSSGCCVFSFEQTMALKKMAEKKMKVSEFEG